MKAWLKGGFIGIIIGVLLLIVDFIVTRFFEFHLFSRLAGFLGIYLYKVFFMDITDPLKSAIFFVPTILFYFIIGALIGWIIERIKSKNKLK